MSEDKTKPEEQIEEETAAELEEVNETPEAAAAEEQELTEELTETVSEDEADDQPAKVTKAGPKSRKAQEEAKAEAERKEKAASGEEEPKKKVQVQKPNPLKQHGKNYRKSAELVDAAFDFVFDRALCDDIGQRILDLGDHFTVLRRRGDAFERRIFEHEPLQGQHALAERRRAHQLQRAELPGAHDDLLLTKRGGQHIEERRHLTAHPFIAAVFATKPVGVEALGVVGHDYFAAMTRMFDFATTLLTSWHCRAHRSCRRVFLLFSCCCNCIKCFVSELNPLRAKFLFVF